MAIRIDASGDKLRRTAGLLDYNAAYTRAGFLYLIAANAYQAAFVSDDGSSNNFDYCGFNVGGLIFRSECGAGGVVQEQAGTELSLNTWYFFGMRRQNATTFNAFAIPLSTLALSATPNNNNSISGRAALIGMDVGDATGTGGASVWLNGRFAGIKEWSAYLSDAELVNEAMQLAPVRWTNLHAWYPALPDTGRRRDYSGNVRDWTEFGTLTDEDGPPTPAPWGGDDGLIAWVVAASPPVTTRRDLLYHGIARGIARGMR